MVAGALSVSEPLSILKPDAEIAEYQGSSSEATFHVFVNETDQPVNLWVHCMGTQGDDSWIYFHVDLIHVNLTCTIVSRCYFYDSQEMGGCTYVPSGQIAPRSNLYIGEDMDPSESDALVRSWT